MTKDEMVGWLHRLNGPEFEKAPGDGEGQGSLVCCSPWGRKECGMNDRLNCTDYHGDKLEKKVFQYFDLSYVMCF